MSYQKVVVVGFLGRDPELRYGSSGTAICNFSMATTRKWTGSDGQPREETTWFRCSTFGKLAESCNQYLQKGRQVLVEGTLTPDPETGSPRIWQDNEGNSRASFELRASTVAFLGGGQSSGERREHDGYPEPTGGLQEDEIPF